MARGTALVTGGNRGIGFEVARQLGEAGLTVLLCARDSEAGRASAGSLRDADLDVHFEYLDLCRSATIASLLDRLHRYRVEVDVLVNAAGVWAGGELRETGEGALREAMEVHFFGPWRLAVGVLGGMTARDFGRVTSLTSGYGTFAGGLAGPGGYAVSKSATNALTRRLAREVSGNVRINAVDPGWVRTRMGGPGAPRSSGEAAGDVVEAVLSDRPEHHGVLLRYGEIVPW